MDKKNKQELEVIQQSLPIVFRFMTVEKVTEVADISTDEQFSQSSDLNSGFIIRTGPARPIFSENEEVSDSNK